MAEFYSAVIGQVNACGIRAGAQLCTYLDVQCLPTFTDVCNRNGWSNVTLVSVSTPYPLPPQHARYQNNVLYVACATKMGVNDGVVWKPSERGGKISNVVHLVQRKLKYLQTQL